MRIGCKPETTKAAFTRLSSFRLTYFAVASPSFFSLPRDLARVSLAWIAAAFARMNDFSAARSVGYISAACAFTARGTLIPFASFI
jgi:hypothetical protein